MDTLKMILIDSIDEYNEYLRHLFKYNYCQLTVYDQSIHRYRSYGLAATNLIDWNHKWFDRGCLPLQGCVLFDDDDWYYVLLFISKHRGARIHGVKYGCIVLLWY